MSHCHWHGGGPRGRVMHVVNSAYADGQAQQVAQELRDAAIRAVANQRSPTITWCSQVLVTATSNSTS